MKTPPGPHAMTAQAGAVDVWGRHVEFAIASARAREAAKAAEETREFQRLIKERSNG